METQIAGKTHLKHDEIAARAYDIWEASGHQTGFELDHWLQAEKELAATQIAQTTSALAKSSQKAAEQPTAPAVLERGKTQPGRPRANVPPRANGARRDALAR